MWAFWFGLDSEKIKWPDGDEIELNGYAILARTYMNLTIKFKHEFAEVDAVCGLEDGHNHINFRFKGGAGKTAPRLTRMNFISGILESQGFKVRRVGDLIEASKTGCTESETQKKLATLGLLIALTATEAEKISAPENSGILASEIIGSVS